MEILVPTSSGPARLTVDAATAPSALLWLGHGAGGGINGADLTALASRLPRLGVTVVRHEQPWRVAGRRIASRPQALDAAWLESLPAVRDLAESLPLVVGGRSAGARVACRNADDVGAVGVVCLGFPLRPPSTPGTSRLSELLTPTVPVLVLQGERDAFGTAAAVRDEAGDAPQVRVVEVPGADHSMRTLKASPLAPAQVLSLIVETVGEFVEQLTGRRGPEGRSL